jgi:hypothetical protein
VVLQVTDAMEAILEHAEDDSSARSDSAHATAFDEQVRGYR